MNEGDEPDARGEDAAVSGPDPAAPAADLDGARDARHSAPRFRRRTLALGDGTSLVLSPSGSIDHVDAAGAVVQTWTTADPGWDGHAIRFGLRPQEPTIAPTRGGRGAIRAPRR